MPFIIIGLCFSNNIKLQSIINAAAGLMGGTPRCVHISGFIRNSLRWSPIQQRILHVGSSNSLSLMRNCLVGVATTYLRTFCTLISSVPATASLRSSTLGLNGYSRMRSATVKFRSFVFFGPLAWSYMYLPQSMRLELSSTVHAPGITIPLTSPATEKPVH